MVFKAEESVCEDVVRDGRKYLEKCFGRSRNIMNNIFLLKMGNTVLLRKLFFLGLFGDTANVPGILFEKQKISMTLAWLRRLVAGPSPQTPVFSSESFHI
jgi:hypothetical protein